MATKYKRSKLLVDKAFQIRLLVRMGGYFFLYILTILHVGFVIEIMTGLAADVLRVDVGQAYIDFLLKYKPLLFSFILIAPVIFYDLLKFSNRVAGPLFRARRVMLEMADGKPVSEFVARKNDLMTELFQAFNRLINAWNAKKPVDQAPKSGDAKAETNGKPAASTHSAIV